MPTYDFRCNACGHVFEVFQSMKDAPNADCPKCGAAAKRLISTGAGIIFKGSGFYQTDYKNKESSWKAGGGKRPAKGSDTKPATGSDAKPAKESETGPAKGSDAGSAKDGKAAESKD